MPSWHCTITLPSRRINVTCTKLDEVNRSGSVRRPNNVYLSCGSFGSCMQGDAVILMVTSVKFHLCFCPAARAAIRFFTWSLWPLWCCLDLPEVINYFGTRICGVSFPIDATENKVKNKGRNSTTANRDREGVWSDFWFVRGVDFHRRDLKCE